MSVFNKTSFVIILFFCYGCEEEVFTLDNPLDPENPEYIPPQITITSGPSDNEVVENSEISFSWDGNEGGMLYQYKFNDYLSPWTENKEAKFEYLDEENYFFKIQSKYTTGDTSKAIPVNFTVDAVKGPALLFYPRRHIATVGNSINFKIQTEEVQNVTGIEFSISFNPSILKINSISKGQYLSSFQETIFHADYDNEAGSLSIISAILGNDLVMSGTGELVNIELEILSEGNAILSFDGTQIFKDINNNIIVINDVINGLVQIE